jgi:hypothetical protein
MRQDDRFHLQQQQQGQLIILHCNPGQKNLHDDNSKIAWALCANFNLGSLKKFIFVKLSGEIGRTFNVNL